MRAGLRRPLSMGVRLLAANMRDAVDVMFALNSTQQDVTLPRHVTCEEGRDHSKTESSSTQGRHYTQTPGSRQKGSNDAQAPCCRTKGGDDEETTRRSR
jgi:hypothetical protein